MNKKCTNRTALSSSVTADLWDTFHERIRRFVAKRVSEPVDAEDILQEIFLRIHLGVSGVQNLDHLQAWIYGIARRTIADFYRARNRKCKEIQAPSKDYLEEDIPFSIKWGQYEGVQDVHEEVLTWLRPMIEKLPGKYRMALMLADIEGLRQQDVATHLGLSLSGAKSRVQRARKMLGKALEACCYIEFGQDGRAISYYKHQS